MNRTCPRRDCPSREANSAIKIPSYGYYKTKARKRRKYQCQVCQNTFSSTTETAYFRIQHPGSKLDQVASLSVEGVNKSAISKVQSVGWNTVHQWLEKAAKPCRQFNRSNPKDKHIRETQTFIPRCVHLSYRNYPDGKFGSRGRNPILFHSQIGVNSHLMTDLPGVRRTLPMPSQKRGTWS